MKTLKETLKEFDEKFYIEENDDWGSVPNPSQVKSFLSQSIKIALESVVPEEDKEVDERNWNCCRNTIKENIQEYLK